MFYNKVECSIYNSSNKTILGGARYSTKGFSLNFHVFL